MKATQKPPMSYAEACNVLGLQPQPHHAPATIETAYWREFRRRSSELNSAISPTIRFRAAAMLSHIQDARQVLLSGGRVSTQFKPPVPVTATPRPRTPKPPLSNSAPPKPRPKPGHGFPDVCALLEGLFKAIAKSIGNLASILEGTGLPRPIVIAIFILVMVMGLHGCTAIMHIAK